MLRTYCSKIVIVKNSFSFFIFFVISITLVKIIAKAKAWIAMFFLSCHRNN